MNLSNRAAAMIFRKTQTAVPDAAMLTRAALEPVPPNARVGKPSGTPAAVAVKGWYFSRATDELDIQVYIYIYVYIYICITIYKISKYTISHIIYIYIYTHSIYLYIV